MNSSYDNHWALKEYVESLERMLAATQHQLSQSHKSLAHLKAALEEKGEEDA